MNNFFQQKQNQKNMKLLKLLTASILFATTLAAQNVGINATGATPDASALLDVSGNNKGLLIPRVNLTATNISAPVTAPAISLLVYNLATASIGLTAVTPALEF